MKKAEAGSGALGRSGSWPASSAVGAAGGLSQQLGSASSTHCTDGREIVVRRSSREREQLHWEGSEAARLQCQRPNSCLQAPLAREPHMIAKA